MDIVTETVQALWRVLLAGLLLGAGLPALYALGLRSLNAGRTVTADGTVTGTTPTANRVLGYALIGLVVAVALFGIVVIVFGDRLFG
jgi:uncharacterized membrane-anchored protein YitT (DUF2179 family)